MASARSHPRYALPIRRSIQLLACGLVVSRAQPSSDLAASLPFLLQSSPPAASHRPITGRSVSVIPGALTAHVVTNATHAVVAIEDERDVRELGYLAVGWGTELDDADMLVFWPDAATNTWQISHRSSPDGHTLPISLPIPSPSPLTILPYPYTSHPEAFVGGTRRLDRRQPTRLTFIRPLELPDDYMSTSAYGSLPAVKTSERDERDEDEDEADGQDDEDTLSPWIFTIGKERPRWTADSELAVAMHTRWAVEWLDLSRAWAPPKSWSNEGQGRAQESSQPWQELLNGEDKEFTPKHRLWLRESILALHALFAAAAYLLLVPTLVLLSRLGRIAMSPLRLSTFYQHLDASIPIPIWLPVHSSLAIVGAVPVALAASALGWLAVSPGGHAGSSHGRNGLLLVAATVLQAALGSLPRSRWQSKTGEADSSLRTRLHVANGLLVMIGGFATTMSGLALQPSHMPSFSTTVAVWRPLVWLVAVGAVVGYVVCTAPSLVARIAALPGCGWLHGATSRMSGMPSKVKKSAESRRRPSSLMLVWNTDSESALSSRNPSPLFDAFAHAGDKRVAFASQSKASVRNNLRPLALPLSNVTGRLDVALAPTGQAYATGSRFITSIPPSPTFGSAARLSRTSEPLDIFSPEALIAALATKSSI